MKKYTIIATVLLAIVLTIGITAVILEKVNSDTLQTERPEVTSTGGIPSPTPEYLYGKCSYNHTNSRNYINSNSHTYRHINRSNTISHNGTHNSTYSKADGGAAKRFRKY